MLVLGISPLDKDATVALMADGKVLYAIAEERFSRQKMHAGFPGLALQKTLDLAGVTAKDIDHVVYSFLDAATESKMMRQNAESDAEFNASQRGRNQEKTIQAALEKIPQRDLQIPGLGDPMEKMDKAWHKKKLYRLSVADGPIGDAINRREFARWIEMASSDHHRFEQELLSGLREFGLADKLERVEHHQTHVANAYYCSGFEEALVITLDGYGSGLAGTASVATPDGLKRVGRIETPYSLGSMYESVTSALGYRPDRHAGKIVGLAAYGDTEILREVMDNAFVWENGTFRIRRSSNPYFARYLATLFPKIDVAAAYQRVLEEVATRFVRHHLEQTGLKNVVMSGGVVANVKMNQRVHEIDGVEQIYIHPGMGDGGCCVGAAVLKFVEKGIVPERMEHAYLGPEYSQGEIEQALRSSGLDYQVHDDVEAEIARLIANDCVVARFNGRMEYGPRALGNRSILYPAKDPEVNQWLNHRLGRTEFMPFAPATVNEDRHDNYLNMNGAEFTSQFMTITFDCTDSMKQDCPAAVHIDGTARPQLVTAESNKSFYEIITKYKEITGISSIINTSFNMHEEPIVCTPEDAIRAFQDGRLDYLAIGGCVAASTEATQAQERIPTEAGAR